MSGDRDRDAVPDLLRPRRTEEFDAVYERTPPWDIGRPQQAFLDLAQRGDLRGRLLDVGCGTGEHALMGAELGLDATGIDVSARAIASAREKAETRGLKARFLVGDALELALLGEQFDTILDCGLFHIFSDAQRPRFAESLQAAMAGGARYYLLCFSNLQPGDYGPRRVHQEELRATFRTGWNIASIEESAIEMRGNPPRAHAWLATIIRTDSEAARESV